jgi:hypothetical protein
MNPLLYLLIGLRSAALAVSVAGDQRLSDRLHTIADGVEAGTVTEEHMRLVAEKLKSRNITEEDWDDVERRIAEDRARLHSP